MRGWLLDTNIISELRKPNPNSKVINFIAAQPSATLFVTDVTLAEITYGIEQLGDAGRRTDLRLWLERNLRPLFAGRILAITSDGNPWLLKAKSVAIHLVNLICSSQPLPRCRIWLW